jgi:hypothetical protein
MKLSERQTVMMARLSYTFLALGVLSFSVSLFFRLNYRPLMSNGEESIQWQRMEAIAEARRQGKETYSFKSDKMPPALSP